MSDDRTVSLTIDEAEVIAKYMVAVEQALYDVPSSERTDLVMSIGAKVDSIFFKKIFGFEAVDHVPFQD